LLVKIPNILIGVQQQIKASDIMSNIEHFFKIISNKINYKIPKDHIDLIKNRINGIAQDSEELKKYKIHNMEYPPKINNNE
jgi:transposase